MRDRFFKDLLNLYSRDQRVVFITGDLGYKLFNPLRDCDSQRCINFGIREASMVGYASGLANEGLLPFVYSIVPFITLRCLEQIKIDLCYNLSPVVLVGVGGGYCYGHNGPTHQGVEDVCVLSCLPGMRVWTPADPEGVSACLRASETLTGPAYLRLGRNEEPNIHEFPVVDIDTPQVIKEGSDGVIVGNGFILAEIMKASKVLCSRGLSPSIIQVTTMNPFPEAFFKDLVAVGKPIMTVEEHIALGGLGQRVASVIAQLGAGNRFRCLAIPDRFYDHSMDREASLRWAGLDAESIVSAFLEIYEC